MITIALVILLIINLVSFVYNIYIWRCDGRHDAYYAAERKYQDYTKELHESVLNLNKSVGILVDLYIDGQQKKESSREDRQKPQVKSVLGKDGGIWASDNGIPYFKESPKIKSSKPRKELSKEDKQKIANTDYDPRNSTQMGTHAGYFKTVKRKPGRPKKVKK